MGNKPYHLTPAAISDLENIWTYSAYTWSPTQADQYIAGLTSAFDLIADNPEIARERSEYSPPVRIYRHRSHIVIYQASKDAVIVIRVRHGNEDWMGDLAGTD
ncbi:type II toxin-antitoxin system RelE/ParE family toxin [Asticcacaulis sp. AND118]|uniref:type II toxin-antitoxin system RelE/ParE family toxin n=1 Tax=Asticcacaulis sp. AND118 TaxID=2840468 RepID=UPI001CFFC00F|nr:type II toxin-antitoxin system RelE/ParE family toxin [Asticcacaulis sp. AND118]UDF05348.1 type II toxin-antitoxin system RelE/ParE family toxin [Asticcacaulis sp. AND118]